MAKKITLIVLALLMIAAAVIFAAVRRKEEPVVKPGETVQWMTAELSNPRQSHEFPVYDHSAIASFLQSCSMRSLHHDTERIYETGEVELTLTMELLGVEGPVTLILGEKALVSREGKLYELLAAEHVEEEVNHLLCRQALESFLFYSDIHAAVNDSFWEPQGEINRSFQDAVLGRRWKAENFFEQCANAPFAVVVITNAAGHQLWVQEDMDTLLLDDGSGACLWLDGGAEDGEILQEIWLWAAAESAAP